MNRQITKHNGARAYKRKASKPSKAIVPVNGSNGKNGKHPVARRSGLSGSIASRLNASWIISGLSADSEIRAGLWQARSRIRTLEWENDYVRKFLIENPSNVLGAEGMILQMKVKEEADRIIHDSKELEFIECFERERNELLSKFRRILIRKGCSESYAKELVPELTLLWTEKGERFRDCQRGERKAMVKKGQPDVFANNLIEGSWKRYGRKENFTVTGELTKRETEGVHYRTTIRDGAGLVRMVKGFENDFGFSLQLIDVDWLDLNYNTILANGNEVRMGKEYNQWKRCVAYHIIVRNPGDWQWQTGVPMGFGAPNIGSYGARQRVEAKEILHPYVRERIDQSREVPWLISSIVRLRMLGKYEEAELVASMAAACKIAVYYSDMVPEGGLPLDQLPDPTSGDYLDELEPGMSEHLPYGVKMDMLNPTHPNGNYDTFRKGMLRGLSVGMPGQVYYALSQDQESVNFSTARMSELPARDVYMGLQRWYADNLHQSIFPNFLEAGMLSGQIKLPMSKIDRYAEAANWIGRRWKGIDIVKEWQANKGNLLLAVTTRAKIIAESTQEDFEEMAFDLANEEDLLRSLGLDALLLENLDGPKASANSTSDGSNPADNSNTDETNPPAKPKPKKLKTKLVSQN